MLVGRRPHRGRHEATQSGNRVVVIGSAAPANEKAGSLPPRQQRPTPRRIVVIKDGELVGGRPAR
jgi:hypothetical protein